MNLQNLFSAARSNSGKNIFISYRVQDTAGETGRLVDALKERFDEKHIFIDIEKIEPGLDFSQVISHSLDSCDVMLAVIGPNWLGLQPSTNTLRIQDPRDWVRLEISTALKRGIRVIPVLVDGASLPSESQLPDDLTPLLMRQAYEVSNKRWKYDTDQLMDFLEKSVGIPPKQARIPSHAPTRRPWLRRNLVWIMITFSLGSFIWLLLVGIAALTDPELNKIVEELNKIPTDTSVDYQPKVIPAGPAVQMDQDLVSEVRPMAVQGIWVDSEGSSFVFSQNNNSFSLEGYSINGELIGTGSGVVNKDDVNFDFGIRTVFMNVDISCQLKLSADGSYMNGSLVNKLTGVSSPLYLTKVQ